MGKIPVVFVLGPTAVGKTEVSIEIARALNGEIISADSMQIYRFMNIGTAKPDINERQGIEHHLLDVVYPNEEFNVSLFQQLAKKKIEDIYFRDKLPIVVGGTGLYINSLIYSLNFTTAGEDKEYRKCLEAQMIEKGKDWLHHKLYLVDPQSANRLHPNDTRRIIRALEVYHLTGKPISKQRDGQDEEDDGYFSFIIGLTMERDKLYERIDRRVDRMLEDGLIDEVKWLIKNGYHDSLNSMQGLGYKEIAQYLAGKRTISEAIYILKRDTRRFAKRQLTWFKRLAHVHWVDVEDFEDKAQLEEYLIKTITENLCYKGM
jgi:tRNA dimethylallyltransferase